MRQKTLGFIIGLTGFLFQPFSRKPEEKRKIAKGAAQNADMKPPSQSTVEKDRESLAAVFMPRSDGNLIESPVSAKFTQGISEYTRARKKFGFPNP